MTPARKSAWRFVLLITPLAAALLYVALNWYTFVDEPIWVNAGKEARENPYLAYTRLLARMGTPPLTPTAAAALDAPPERGTLVIADRRLAYMTPDRVRKIAAWVERGGHLVADTEDNGIDDPLLDAFGIERVFPKPEDAAKGPRPAGPRAFSRATPTAVTIDWPELGKPLHVRMRAGVLSLRDTRVHTDDREARIGSEVVALSVAHGQGRVTTFQTIEYLRNGAIGDLDHAEFGWRLASNGPVMLFLRIQSPPFLEWLWRDAWTVVLAAALLLLLWLARIIPRFGPLAPEPPPARRSLLEHVVATGRYLWSRGQGAYLLDALRERAWRAARRRGVGEPGATPERSARAIAEVAGMSEARARRAFAGPAPAAPAFVDAAAALQDIETRLARRDGARPERKMT